MSSTSGHPKKEPGIGWGGIGWLIGERKRNGRNMGLCETMFGLLHRQSDVQQSVFKGCLRCQLTTILDLGNSPNTYDEWYAGEGMVLQSGLLCAAAGRTPAVVFNGLSLKNQASGAESETALTWKRVQLEYAEPGLPDVLSREKVKWRHLAGSQTLFCKKCKSPKYGIAEGGGWRCDDTRGNSQ